SPCACPCRRASPCPRAGPEEQGQGPGRGGRGPCAGPCPRASCAGRERQGQGRVGRGPCARAGPVAGRRGRAGRPPPPALTGQQTQGQHSSEPSLRLAGRLTGRR
ncbi:MAG: hypothetical protein ACK559_04560, partial [bacterium]